MVVAGRMGSLAGPIVDAVVYVIVDRLVAGYLGSSRRADRRTAAVGGEDRRVSAQRPERETTPANGILTARCLRAG